MDQDIFDQLDMLDYCAHAESQAAQYAEPPYADHAGYNLLHPAQYEPAEYQQDAYTGGSYAEDSPLILDSFDEYLLRQPDHMSRQGQAALGRARLSLPPARSQVGSVDMAPPSSFAPLRDDEYHGVPRAGAHCYNYNYDSIERLNDTSSSLGPQLSSSPALEATRRRPAGRRSVDRGRLTQDRTPVLGPYAAESQEIVTVGPQRPDTADWQHYQQSKSQSGSRKARGTLEKGEAPTVQGIKLITTQALPDRFRAAFPFPLFNAVQSKCFQTIYQSNDNFVLSSPTGSGKTAVMELAICRLVHNSPNGSFKIVYQAPTKALCSERQRDWQKKFAHLDLQCAELTGDTEAAQLRNVQHASIIITTPEKWDSITRKWKDHHRLMQMVRLFLIDEVHILKEDRGATLEAVVSRMKSVGSDVRFVALSATVPNAQDIAVWLGQDPVNAHIPAAREKFGEEFRPVRLQKHVCGYQTTSNNFAFDKTLTTKLPEVIAKWSQKKPIMVFCFTRNACVETAKSLAAWWATKGPGERYWDSPRKRVTVGDTDLQETISAGVAFHHAGLAVEDKTAVENGYLQGDISVICSTSTLAVGVNLPCHMVIIKNTVAYQHNAAGCKEYSDLEIMQMLGRAGRPQFDNSAVAVIMTRLQRVPYYEKMITGQEILESCLHRNLTEHLNAEIGLGTITDASAAKKWLSGTFLYVRLKDHPEHYKIEGDAPGRNLDERLETICSNAVASLSEHNLITSEPTLRCTEFGDAMARYYLQFETMKILLALPEHAKVSEILSSISQANEFKDIRFRAGEKPTYKQLNQSNSIKFPIPGNLDASAHKVSLIIQSTLGGVDIQTEDHKQRHEYNTSKAMIFQHAPRLIRCIVDCQLYLKDSVATRNALMLARSLGAQVWDDSPLHMKQLEGVGVVTARKLVAAGIRSVEEVESTAANRIEVVLSRNPPFGMQLQQKAKAFPRLRVSVKVVGEPVVDRDRSVKIRFRASVAFMNEKVPEMFQRRPVYVCLLAESSDGKVLEFARIGAKKMGAGQDVPFEAHLADPAQTIRVYAMCDDVAGSLQHAYLKPDIPASLFPARMDVIDQPEKAVSQATKSNRPRASGRVTQALTDGNDEDFGDDINDEDLALAEADGFVDIDLVDLTADTDIELPKRKKQKTSTESKTEAVRGIQQLPDGKWACNHACKDKKTCKHLCCREGLDKKPKSPKAKTEKKKAGPTEDSKQTQLSMSVVKKTDPGPKTTTASIAQPASRGKSNGKPCETRKLQSLHDRVNTNTPAVPTLNRSTSKRKFSPPSAKIFKSRPTGVPSTQAAGDALSSDYGNEFASIHRFVTEPKVPQFPSSFQANDDLADKDGDMLDCLGGLDDDVPIHQDATSDARADPTTMNQGNLDDHAYDDPFDELDDFFRTQDPLEQGTARTGRPLFIGEILDSFTPHYDSGRTGNDTAGHNPGDNHTDIRYVSEFFAPLRQSNEATREFSSGQRREVEKSGRGPPTGDAAAVVTDAAHSVAPAGQSTPEDQKMKKWFEEFLGSDLFTYTD